jgi:acyl transferase domain-containing protein
LITKAMVEARIQYLGYVASHGTGTPLGDPIETGALRKAVAPSTSLPENHEAFTVGAIKTLTGHLEGTAGLAGLMVNCLQLRNRFAHGLRYR